MNSITKSIYPTTMYLDMAVSDTCNMHCKHCHIWTNKGGGNAVTLQRRSTLVNEFARLQGELVFFTGGEVTKDTNDLTYMLDVCKSHRLRSGFATNGSYITSIDVARRILNTGVDHIILSIDSHEKPSHDWVRGPGSYDSVTEAMKFLIEAKEETSSSAKLIFQQVLFKRNLPFLDNFIQFAKEFGASYVDWQMLCGTYNNQSHHDPFFENQFWHSESEKEEAKQQISFIIEKYKSDSFLIKKPHDTGSICDYIDNPEFTRDVICDSANKNVVINYKGEVSLCFSDPGHYPYIGNINEGTLKGILMSQEAKTIHSYMEKCKKGCGVQECHRKNQSAPYQSETQKHLKILQ